MLQGVFQVLCTFLVALSFRSYCQTMFMVSVFLHKIHKIQYILTSKFYYSRTSYMYSKVHETGHCLNFGDKVNYAELDVWLHT